MVAVPAEAGLLVAVAPADAGARLLLAGAAAVVAAAVVEAEADGGVQQRLVAESVGAVVAVAAVLQTQVVVLDLRQRRLRSSMVAVAVVVACLCFGAKKRYTSVACGEGLPTEVPQKEDEESETWPRSRQRQVRVLA